MTFPGKETRSDAADGSSANLDLNARASCLHETSKHQVKLAALWKNNLHTEDNLVQKLKQ